jgi:xanthine/uracil/vitamin C permease (AzgA family)
MSTEYIPAKSHTKALRVAFPPGAALVLVWCAREFLHREIPADVALAILAGVAYGAEWARNKIKHGIGR